MARILVTGGAGYIGSITVRALLDAGHTCVVLDSLERGYRDAVDSRAQLIVGDVGNRVVLDEVLQDCEAVVHLAGLIDVAESELYPEKYRVANTEKPTVLLHAMCDHGIQNLVFSSTAAVYGTVTQWPISEDTQTSPASAYGRSKLAFENVIDSFGDKGIRAIKYRYFNVAGAWPDGSLGESHRPETHIIPRVLGAIRSGERSFEVFGGDYPTPDGTCVRDYLHVVDLAEAHRLGLERLLAGGSGGVFNLGSGRGYSNLEVVEACGEVTGIDLEVRIADRRAGDPATLVASAERARTELGWDPRRGALHMMIEDAWQWHTARPNGFDR